MPATPDSGADLRRLSPAELARRGADSLREHIAAQAAVAHYKHAPLAFAGLDAFLADRECVRYPTRLAFEPGAMEAHQFAQPGPDPLAPDPEARVLWLRPALRGHPDLALLAVAYMIPVINYGDLATDEHCVRYGATLLGMPEADFYDAVCRMADAVGAAPAPPPGGPTEPA
ncbi:MAG TPA: hypothetical protein PK815_11430 [Verrucomicrobiota bacterium]|nr:hypothetical protein [Verrucomicrobiota bacterium]